MYLRTTKRKNGDGATVAYFQLAENDWDPERRCAVARVIYNVGRADSLDADKLRSLARSILRVCSGEEQIEALEGVRLLDARKHGALHVLEAIWKELGIPEILSSAARKAETTQPFERAIFAMVANRALSPYSKLYCYEQWLREEVYLRDGDKLELQHLYRGMDFLERHKEQLEKAVYFAAADLTKADVDLIFYDTTSLHFEIDEEDEEQLGKEGRTYEPLRKRGHSKNGRTDAPQIVIGLAVTRTGLPVRSWVFAGNTGDITTVERVKEDLRGWKLGRCVFVGDAGMNSEANRRQLALGGGKFILASKLRAGDEVTKDVLARAGRYKTVAGNLRVKEVIVGDGERRRRYVVCHNPQEEARQSAHRQKLLTMLEAELASMRSSAGSHSKRMCELVASARFGRYLRETKSGLAIDRAAVTEAERYDGKWVVTSNDDTLSVEDLALGYKQLLRVEQCWRTLKSALRMRPVFHWRPWRIQAHVTISVLALLLERIVEERVGDTWRNVAAQLDEVKVVEYVRGEARVRQTGRTRACEATYRLVQRDALGSDRAPRAPSTAVPNDRPHSERSTGASGRAADGAFPHGRPPVRGHRITGFDGRRSPRNPSDFSFRSCTPSRSTSASLSDRPSRPSTAPSSRGAGPDGKWRGESGRGEPARLHAYERRPGAASAPLPRAYRRREPEATVLHCVVREHLETLLAQAREASDYGHGLPRMMERELRAYLACGVLAHGFSRVKCGACGHELLVAFSCKGRGVCPSCTARRANDTAAHLVDRVLPRVPVRQYVLTFPKRIRWHLATDPSLASAALNLFLRALFAFQRRCARRDDVRDGKPGAVTFVQRFGSALNLNLHFHCVVPDGVFVEPRGAPRDAPLEFHPLRPPEDEDVEALLRKTASRVIAMLRKRGRLDAGERANDLDALGALQATSLMSSPPAPRDAYPPQASRRNAFLDGFSLHANTHLRGEDREGIERLCMYGARGPLAVSRLRELPDGRLVYRMKRKAASGADELVLQPLELLRKLVALVPPPRVHLTRFHGVFAPNAGARHRVVPEREGEEPTCASASAADAVPVPPQEPHLLRPLADEAPRNRVPWAALLRRSFEIDVFQCPNCPGRMRVVAYLDEPTVTAKILDHLGLPSHAPPIAPARERPQLELAG